MNEYVVSFYKNGSLTIDTILAHDLVHASRMMTRKHSIPAEAIFSIIRKSK